MSCASVGQLHYSVWSLLIFVFKLEVSFDLLSLSCKMNVVKVFGTWCWCASLTMCTAGSAWSWPRAGLACSVSANSGAGSLRVLSAGICRGAAPFLLVPLHQHSGSKLHWRDAWAQVSPQQGPVCSAPSCRALPAPPWHRNAQRGFSAV